MATTANSSTTAAVSAPKSEVCVYCISNEHCVVSLQNGNNSCVLCQRLAQPSQKVFATTTTFEELKELEDKPISAQFKPGTSSLKGINVADLRQNITQLVMRQPEPPTNEEEPPKEEEALEVVPGRWICGLDCFLLSMGIPKYAGSYFQLVAVAAIFFTLLKLFFAVSIMDCYLTLGMMCFWHFV
jgi:hypothetical protein